MTQWPFSKKGPEVSARRHRRRGKTQPFQCTSATLVAWILNARILGGLRGIEIFGGMGGEWIESKICFPVLLDMVIRSYTIMLEVAVNWTYYESFWSYSCARNRINRTKLWQVVEQGPRCFEPVTQAWSKTWELEDVLIFMVSFFMTLGFRWSYVKALVILEEFQLLCLPRAGSCVVLCRQCRHSKALEGPIKATTHFNMSILNVSHPLMEQEIRISQKDQTHGFFWYHGHPDLYHERSWTALVASFAQRQNAQRSKPKLGSCMNGICTALLHPATPRKRGSCLTGGECSHLCNESRIFQVKKFIRNPEIS